LCSAAADVSRTFSFPQEAAGIHFILPAVLDISGLANDLQLEDDKNA
jgi:hypothetical protein